MKKGDRIIYRGRRHGIVVKVTKASVLVLFDGAEEEERFPLSTLRIETAYDIRRRDHEAAVRAWRDHRPHCTEVRVVVDSYGVERSACVYGARTPEQMRITARELVDVADWFVDRPESS